MSYSLATLEYLLTVLERNQYVTILEYLHRLDLYTTSERKKAASAMNSIHRRVSGDRNLVAPLLWLLELEDTHSQTPQELRRALRKIWLCDRSPGRLKRATTRLRRLLASAR